jgi:hypothetical protein
MHLKGPLPDARRAYQLQRTQPATCEQALLGVRPGQAHSRLLPLPRRQVNGTDRHEVLVGGEGLQRGSSEVLATLLHEAAHGLAQARKLQDTSRGGRYHNRRYATLARELGLEVASVKPIGWSATTVPEHTTAAYAAQLEELQAALVLWRRQEHRIGPGPRARNLLAAACGCGRRIRAARATLADAPILCGACAQPFEPEEPEN